MPAPLIGERIELKLRTGVYRGSVAIHTASGVSIWLDTKPPEGTHLCGPIPYDDFKKLARRL